MSVRRSSKGCGARRALLCAGVVLAGAQVAAQTTPQAPFPTVRPASRHQAVTVLTGGGSALPVPCLTPLIQSHGESATAPAARRAMALLRAPVLLPGERRRLEPDGTILRYTTARGAFDRIDATDEDGNGWPDALDTAARAMADARELLVGRFGLREPEAPEVLLVRIARGIDGYLVPSGAGGARGRVVLEASGATPIETLRRSAIHQYAHAVGLETGAGLPAAWGEALASWAVMRLTGGPGVETSRVFSERLGRMEQGLVTHDLELAAGNAIWFAFLEEAYGPGAVRFAAEELAAGASAVSVALERALQRTDPATTLAAALREFQLWTLLVGDRDDGRHLSFAARLDPPVFAKTVVGLPALSVQAEPRVAPLGASKVLLRPEAGHGGLRVHFEGDFSTPWQVDLLLVGERGALRRLALPLSPEGRGEVTVPLDAVGEAVLMVRNLGPEDGAARPFSWAADHEPGYPYELASLEALWPSHGSSGALITWETSSERQLLGFDILRTNEEAGGTVKINPVWIPAVGQESLATSYQFLDRTAQPGVGYAYRIRAITVDGLTSESEPVLTIGPRPQR